MTFHVEERVTIMKKKLVPILGISFALLLLASGCTNKKESRSDDAQKAVTTEKKDDTAQSSSDKGEQDTVSAQQGKSEEDYQRKEGVNGPLPAVNYTYDAIVDAAGGICRFPSVYEEHYQENVKTWNRQVKEEVKKITPKLTEEASDKEIQHLFQQFLYIAGYDYPVFEPIERYSYVVFKKDMEDPFTHKKINEDVNVHLEIVLDCSGSMAKNIDGKTMMEIAKQSIGDVLSKMPEKAKVGLRVFGHKGNNEESGKKESCAACELIHPIDVLDKDKMNASLQPIRPTGWTCIAKSMEEGVKDLSSFKEEKDLNILFIVTDGIETCGGDPIAMANKLKGEHANIVLGIIGFNVDANQNLVLKQIADAAEGYYASAYDAASLTGELQTIHELAYSTYKWQKLDTALLNTLKGLHTGCLSHNKIHLQNGPIAEKNSLTTLLSYAGAPDVGLFPSGSQVEKKLRALIEERYQKITALFEEEAAKREKESQDYFAAITPRLGETVAVIPMTSRINPSSDYWKDYSNKGGNSQSQQEDTSRLEESVHPDSK